jgi:hypothetical protein
VTPADEAVRARKLWRTCEPYHGFIYFAPEAAEEYASIDITGRTGYFASRSAAMGRCSTATVVATFSNFHPGLVAHAMDGWPPDVTPADVLAARRRAVDRVLRERLGAAIGSAEMVRAAELAARAADGLEHRCAGRPLGAAHAALPVPDEAHLALWWAITALREHRGDGHLAALVDAELTGLESLVVHAASGEVPAEVLRTTRGWSEDEWAAALAGLAAAGIVDADGSFTDAGAALRQQVEDRTDRLAAGPWSQLEEAEASELRDLVRPWSKALFAGR